MAANQEEINRREKAAIAAIKNAFGAENDEYGGTLFVTHHLVEIEKDYWRDHLATTQPEPMQVLEILVLKSHWGGDDGIDTFDFTLPGDVTDYVISVRFDEEGKVEDIAMES